MSYGRTPFYIWQEDDDRVFFTGPGCLTTPDQGLAYLPGDALAQFIASVVVKGELDEWLERGKTLRDSAIHPDLHVEVSGPHWRE